MQNVTKTNLRLPIRWMFTTLFVLALSQPTQAGGMPPANDNCADAILLTPGTVTGSLVDATNDGVSTCDALTGGADVWYRYTPTTCDAFIEVNTCGTADLAAGVDTILTLYDGCSGNELGCNDDHFGSCGVMITTDSAAFASVFLGEEVWIRVSGVAGAVGEFTLTIQEDCMPTCPPASSPTCTTDCSTGDITVDWTNSGSGQQFYEHAVQFFDSNGNLAHEAFSFAEAGPAGVVVSGLPNDTYNIEILSLCGDGTLNFEFCGPITLQAYGNQPNVILRGEAQPGVNDSVSALTTALDAIGEDYFVIDSFDYPCLDALTGSTDPIFWALLGSGSNGYMLSPADGQKLVDLQAAGVAVYLESADNWGFNPAHPFLDTDGVEGLQADLTVLENGDSGFLAMNGQAHSLLDLSSFANTPYSQDGVVNESTDRLVATSGTLGSGVDLLGSDAGLVWVDSDEGYGAGVFYRTPNGMGNVISQSWEFGGFGGDQAALAQRYVDALRNVEPPFRRGDCNGDGGFDIADVIKTLDLLFNGDQVQCSDACDGNDDGMLDIADAIAKLDNLFGPGAPLPAPEACGVDPTIDSLGCIATPCP